MQVISVQGVKKRYDGFTAVDGVSFSIRKGEIFAILGPNGAGKTTILKMLCSLIRPSEGSIKYNIKHTDIRTEIGYMPEESALYDNMKVSGYLDFFAGLYRVKSRAHELMNLLELEDKMISHLSKGNRRKVLIARSLINDPEILVYDEPASGLDPVIAKGLLEHILKLRSMGKTIVLSAHDLAMIEEISDTILILDKGRIDLMGSINKIREDFGQNEYVAISRKNHVFKTKKGLISHINEHKVRDIQIREKSLHEIFVDKFRKA